MTTFKRSIFKNDTIDIDGIQFYNCKFEKCTIIYSAKTPPYLVECEFIDCQWLLEGGAKLTLQFLNSMYNEMGEFGKKMVEATFVNIKKPNPQVVALNQAVETNSAQEITPE